MSDNNDESEKSDIDYEVQHSDSNDDILAIVPVAMQSTPALAAMALAITSQEWHRLGQGDDPNVMASSDLNITVERIVSLFVIRLVALISDRNQHQENPDTNIPTYTDLSTTTICQSALQRKKPWPAPITAALIQQVRLYVRRILEQYNGVYYHNFEHAYHVTLSCNKLLDMILHETDSDMPNEHFRNHHHVHFHRKTFGLKSDPIMHLALLYSALIHDVEHKGVPNRQLVQESDDLAILYNDQSVAEQRSLAVAFSELMKEEFAHLRKVMFASPEEYRRFRHTVINLVLATDIASPERTQLIKSKWTEAFGKSQESMDRKSRRSIYASKISSQAPSMSNSSSSGNSTSMTASSRNRNPLRRQGSGPHSVTSAGLSSLSVAFSDVTIDAALRSKVSTTQLTNIDSEGETSATPESTDDYLEDLAEDVDSDDDAIFTGTTLSTVKRDNPTDGSGRMAVGSPKISLIRSVGETSNFQAENKDALSRGLSTSSEGVLAMPTMKMTKSDTFARPGMNIAGRRQLALFPDEKSTSAMSCPAGSMKMGRMPMTTMNRRNSSPMLGRTHSVRLGIRRSLDLTGEQIENYTASCRSITSRSTKSGLQSPMSHIDFDPDEADPMKTSVVMEQIIRSADISSNMQSFEHMEKWSHRLFFELKASFHDGRGEDPQNGWYNNQITFLDSYILPLARRMEDTGVFGDAQGQQFANIVLKNRGRWVKDGLASTSQVIQEWNMIAAKRGVLDTR